MANDGFKWYQSAGADLLEAARMRAEDFLRELAKMGDSTHRHTQGALSDLAEGGRRGTDQILDVIKGEITAQLSLLGLATKADLAALERRLSARSVAAGTTKKAAGTTKKAAGAPGGA